MSQRTVEDFGYKFNEHGELRDEKGNGYVFKNQADYDAIGDAVTDYLYGLMMTKYGMEKLPVIESHLEDELKEKGELDLRKFGFIFGSPNYWEKKTLLVLIHGSGAVRAGQWGRRLIINENIAEGSQMPYIERAYGLDWGVLVFNTNHNAAKNDKTERLKFSSTPGMHARNAWLKYVRGYENIKDIHVVAHSAGGSNISEVMQNFGGERVLSIILTDSWYSGPKILPIVNFSASNSPGKPFKITDDIIFHVYSGSNQHDRTSAACIDGAFHYMENIHNTKSMADVKWLVVESACRVRGGCESGEKQLAERERESSDGESSDGTISDDDEVKQAMPTDESGGSKTTNDNTEHEKYLNSDEETTVKSETSSPKKTCSSAIDSDDNN